MRIWDDDIQGYTRAFTKHREKMFAQEVDSEPMELAELEVILELTTQEDARFLCYRLRLCR